MAETALSGREVHSTSLALLGAIPKDQQLTLRFHKVSACVHTCIDPPSLMTRLRRTVNASERKKAEAAAEKQVGLHLQFASSTAMGSAKSSHVNVPQAV